MHAHRSLPPGQLAWGRPTRNRSDGVRLSDDQLMIATTSSR